MNKHEEKKTTKKKLVLMVSCLFAGFMMLNVSTTIIDSNFSVTGLTSLAYGTPPGGGGSDCDGVTCEYDFIEGFRCFYTGSSTYTCEDQGSGSCSDIRCDN